MKRIFSVILHISFYAFKNILLTAKRLQGTKGKKRRGEERRKVKGKGRKKKREKTRQDTNTQQIKNICTDYLRHWKICRRLQTPS